MSEPWHRQDAINRAAPRIMHVDLNSCFATIEQQARRHWRGKPVGVAAYENPKGIILAASYEAKKLGIRLGTRVKEARQICPYIHITTTDPPKYRAAHRLFSSVLEEVTPRITAKSIDEFVLELDDCLATDQGKSMKDIGRLVKTRVHEVVGEAVFCNVGIGPNRFLAKLAAGLNKPDGLDTISADNLKIVYAALQLKDLPGINRRFDARLRLAGINTPLEFLNADRQTLKFIFGGIVGFYWWLRLRGYEIDDQPTKLGTIGHQYALPQPLNYRSLQPVLYKLCEKTSRRLRKKALIAHGIRIGCRYQGYKYWHMGRTLQQTLLTSQDIFAASMELIEQHAPRHLGHVTLVDVHVYSFGPLEPQQLSFIAGDRPVEKKHALAEIADSINDKYGEFSLMPATMIGTETSAKDAIAFGKLD